MAQVIAEMKRYKLDILGVSESRWKKAGLQRYKCGIIRNNAWSNTWEYWTGNRAFWLVGFSYWPSDCLSRVTKMINDPVLSGSVTLPFIILDVLLGLSQLPSQLCSSNLEQEIPFWETLERKVGSVHISSTEKSTKKTSISLKHLHKKYIPKATIFWFLFEDSRYLCTLSAWFSFGAKYGQKDHCVMYKALQWSKLIMKVGFFDHYSFSVACWYIATYLDIR